MLRKREYILKDKRIMVGIGCILISCLGFALMQLFVKLSGDLPTMQKTFFRNLIAALIALVPIIKYGANLNSVKGNWWLIVLRSLFGTLGIVLNFYAVSNIDLGDAAMLQKLSPFIVIIVSLIFLKEKVRNYQWFAVVLAFIGAIFVIKPVGGFLTLGAVAGFLGAVMAGSAYTCMRALTLRGVKGTFIIFFFSVFSCIAVLPFVIVNFKPMTLIQVVFLILVGISAALGQFGITFGYSYAAARSISVFEYSQILFASLLGYFILDEIPDKYSILGYIIIIFVGVYMILKGTGYAKSNNNKSK